MKRQLILLLTLFTICNNLVLSQGTEEYGSGLKLNLDTSGKRYIRFLTWHQVWLRHNDNNPGSQINGDNANSQWDMGFRRSRFLFYAQINPNFLILTHFGINNSNQVSGGGLGQGASGADGKKPQLFIHDAWVEHKVYKEALSLGVGLHYWQGPSRMGSGSTLNFLAIDAPIFNWQNIEATDQFARQFGIYAKGKLLNNKRIDYRASINFPYALPKNTALTTLDTTAARNNVQIANYKGGGQPKNAYQGYIQYQFWGIESNLLPFTVGTYLGTKKVFNVGIGAYYQADAMWSAKLNQATSKIDTVLHHQLFLSADAFLDLPLKKGFALTAYVNVNHFNMGPNYVRNIGIDNPTNGTTSSQVMFNGGGNTMPTIGTGNIFYAQAGLLLPKVDKLGKFQPYAAIKYAQFERLKDDMITPDVGINWYLNGHSAKVTFNYRWRSVYNWADRTKRFGDVVFDQNRGEFAIQFQIYL